jgi:hypothetical protein
MVKGYGGWMVRSIQELRALRGSTSFKPYAVGECWDSERTIDDWLDEANAWSDNPVGAFDFPLRWRLRDLCDSYGFSLRNLAERGVLVWDRPAQAVTFVENHDVVRDSAIINDKRLAYAFILTHEGYPSVFCQDYFNWDLAQPNNQNGINALIKIHEQNAGGAAQVLLVNDDLYVMQRLGDGDQSGLIFVLNNRASWTARGFKHGGTTRGSLRRRGAVTMTQGCRRKNGLTSPAGSISGRRLVVMWFTRRGEQTFRISGAQIAARSTLEFLGRGDAACTTPGAGGIGLMTSALRHSIYR